jgi:mRNA-degrading endonuclease toxin of MazEF toxin-antitoxin module
LSNDKSCKEYPFEIEIKNEKITRVILSDQIKSLEWIKRNATFIIKAPEEKIKEVAEKALINGLCRNNRLKR